MIIKVVSSLDFFPGFHLQDRIYEIKKHIYFPLLLVIFCLLKR